MFASVAGSLCPWSYLAVSEHARNAYLVRERGPNMLQSPGSCIYDAFLPPPGLGRVFVSIAFPSCMYIYINDCC